MHRPSILLAAVVLAGVRLAAAQRLTPGFLGAAPRTALRDVQAAPPDNAAMTMGGLLGGAVGVVAGGLAGAALGGGDRLCGDDPCGFEEAVWGAAVGMSVMLPLGVHLANHRRGSYGTELVASLVVGAVGLGLSSQSNNGAPLVLVPVGQLVASILIERSSGAR
jgi:hypothetical protein